MWLVALTLGLVEGSTEFLPVSSTGHLILASSLLRFGGRRADLFTIFVQLGAILSVVWEYRFRLKRLIVELPSSSRARGFAGHLTLAFVPAAILGFVLHEFVVRELFHPATVAAALIVGALLILLVESLPLRRDTRDVESLSWRQALLIGLAQCLALWPGFSRSAATILGGLAGGLDRRTATEFSFLLALPTMFAATFYALFKRYRWLEPGDAAWLLLAVTISFLVAWASIRWLLRYVSTRSFRVFAWYRLAVGLVILVVLSR